MKLALVKTAFKLIDAHDHLLIARSLDIACAEAKVLTLEVETEVRYRTVTSKQSPTQLNGTS